MQYLHLAALRGCVAPTKKPEQAKHLKQTNSSFTADQYKHANNNNTFLECVIFHEFKLTF